MSLITRCPACETLFKVVPDQLRISEGWVRCGHCDEVFDASAHLVREFLAPSVPSALLPAREPPSAPLTDAVQEEVQAVSSQFLDLDLDFSELENTENPLAHLDFGGEPASSDSSGRPTESPVPGVISPGIDLPASEVGLESEGPVSDKSPIGSAEVSFLRPQNETPAWHKPQVRIGLGMLGVALLLTLAGQTVFHERDRLAAHEPRLTPWLVAFCAPLGCSLSPLQRIESVVIESSSFARIQGETYRLSFTLKNTSRWPLAMPAVELTLTDSIDQAVLRRVVSPADLGRLPGTLDAGLTIPVAVTLLVKLDTASERIAGYRLLAFYP